MKLQLKKHYFAVCRSLIDGKYFISNMLYTSEEEARTELGACYHALWIDGPQTELQAAVEPKPQKEETQDELFKT